MKELRDYLLSHQGLLLQTLQLATCGYYLLSLDKSSSGFLVDRRVFTKLGHPFEDRNVSIQDFMSLIHEDDVAGIEQRNAIAAANREATSNESTHTYRMRRADGSYRYTVDVGQTVQPGADGVLFWLGLLHDVDASMRAQQLVESQRDQMRQILDTIPTFVWTKDHDGRILTVNQSAADASGKSREEIEGKTTAEVYPQQAKRYRDTDRAVMQNDANVHRTPEKLEHPDGGHRLMLVDKYPIRDVFGERILVVGTDVTESEQAKIAIEKSARQFRELFNSSPMGMLLIDKKGRIRLCNSHLSKVFGYDENALLDQPLNLLIPAKSHGIHDRHREEFQQASSSRQMGGGRTFQGLREDGRTIELEITLTETSIDQEPMTLATVIDVSESQRAQTQLRLAAEAGDIGFWELDLPGNHFEVSEQLLAQIGRTENWSDREEFLADVHQADQEAVVQFFNHLVGEDREHREVIFRMIHSDGSLRWILSRGSVQRANRGEVHRLVGFHIDVTDQQTMQNELREKTHELERSNHELNRFAYIASHDLKSPLRGIQHLTNWITEDLPPNCSVEVKENLDRLHRQADRMNRLLEDLLSYARIGRRVVEPELVDTARMISGVFEFISPPEDAQLVIEGDLPVFVTHRAGLEQVFRNLISNSISHRTDPALRVTVACETTDSMFEFSVSDNGIGIHPRHHDRIFEMFQSLKSKDAGAGSGMGLAIIRRVIELEGGRIWVESEEGAGATFRFTWPMTDEPMVDR